MTETQIEQLLRQAPEPRAPAGLLQTLQREIILPRAQSGRVNHFDSRPWLRRWLPALSFAAFFVACVVAIAVQTNLLVELKRENATLRAAAQNLDQLRADNAEYQRLLAQSQELEKLRQDNADLQRLRGETDRLRAQLPELEKLRTANQKLQAQISNNQPVAANPNDDFFAQQKAKAESVRCINNLKQVGLAGRLWAQDNGDNYPPDFLSMTNELSTWKILQCPSDKSRTVTSWSYVASGNISYQMISPGINVTNFHAVVFALCPIHGHVCLIDGSVQELGTNYQSRLKVIDGKTILGP